MTLIENAPDAVAVLRDARVLVNPIFSGSGVNVKSVEMLIPERKMAARDTAPLTWRQSHADTEPPHTHLFYLPSIVHRI